MNPDRWLWPFLWTLRCVAWHYDRSSSPLDPSPPKSARLLTVCRAAAHILGPNCQTCERRFCLPGVELGHPLPAHPMSQARTPLRQPAAPPITQSHTLGFRGDHND